MPENNPRRLYQTDSYGLLVADAIVYSSFLGEQELFPAGSRTAPPLPHGPHQINRTTGPSVDAEWEVIPDYRGFIYWLADGAQHTINAVGVEPPLGYLTEPPPPTPEQFQQIVGRAVDQMLDELAQSWRYRNYISARSYANDPNPRFAAEAAALITYGSACFTVLDDLEAAVIAGTAQMPSTVEEVLALLPSPPARPVVP